MASPVHENIFPALTGLVGPVVQENVSFYILAQTVTLPLALQAAWLVNSPVSFYFVYVQTVWTD